MGKTLMDTALFVISKLVGALLRPDTWIVHALIFIVLVLVMNRSRLALWF
jgi:hypothetical protein